jgi:hypothetical protein
MKKRIKILIPLIVVSFLLAGANSYAEEGIRFNLAKKKLQQEFQR